VKLVLPRCLAFSLAFCLFGSSTACGQQGDSTAAGEAATQQGENPNPIQTIQTIRTSTSLVLVPALVTTKSGDPVFTLQAGDFTVLDDGVPQTLRLEEDTDRQPLALVVIIQAGGAGASHLQDYQRLGTLFEAMVGSVEHTVAVVGFDSQAALVQPFTASLDTVDNSIRGIGPGDGKAAILDAVGFAVDLLRKQPPKYRRTIVMLSETHDSDSQIKLVDALRAVSDTNTSIYTFAFSSTKAEAKKEASGFSSTEPGPAHGCFARDPKADPNSQPSRKSQDYDCLAELAPLLRLARIAVMAAMGALRSNVPETIAHLTGGEYYPFSNEKNLERGLGTLTNHLPNRYVLSFHPANPHPGLHAVQLYLKDRPNLKTAARTSYWAAEAGDAPQ